YSRADEVMSHTFYLFATPALTFYISFAFYRSRPHRNLHSFPTRRSSDLALAPPRAGPPARARLLADRGAAAAPAPHAHVADRRRSEEHTSELQSRFDLVCRLLLEKKKKKKTLIYTYIYPQTIT